MRQIPRWGVGENLGLGRSYDSRRSFRFVGRLGKGCRWPTCLATSGSGCEIREPQEPKSRRAPDTTGTDTASPRWRPEHGQHDVIATPFSESGDERREPLAPLFFCDFGSIGSSTRKVQECPAPFKPACKVSRNRLIRRNPINSECLVPQATSGPFDLASVQASLLAILCLRLRPVLARLQGQADMGALESEYLRLSSAASTSASSSAGM